MKSTVIASGGPYVFVVSVADSTDAGTTLTLDVNFPRIQSLQPSKTGSLATGGIKQGDTAYNPTGPAAAVTFLAPYGSSGTIKSALTSAFLALNADGTPVLNGAQPTVTVAGTVTAGAVLWVAIVPASFG